MSLTKSERFRLKREICDELERWEADRINLLFGEFGLAQMESWNDPTFGEILAPISDIALGEMYGVVLGLEPGEVQNAIEGVADDGNWKSGYARVFLSHSAMHKQFVGEIADELAVMGIHGFVAHDTMAYEAPWQAQIEHALRTMQAFVLLVHPEVNDSGWCHQEIGWALGRNVPHYVVRLGADPQGFLGREQWPSAHNQSAKHVADVISSWVATVPELGEPIIEGLFEALAGVGNYMDAGATASRIAALGTLTDAQFERLAKIWWSNDQLYGSILATRGLEPLYTANDRSWPPPKPRE